MSDSVAPAPATPTANSGRLPPIEAIALLSRIFLIISIAFGTALVTCLSALPNAAGKPELVDLYVMVMRFSLTGLISAFLWYIPLVVRLQVKDGAIWSAPLRWLLSGISVVGIFMLTVVFFRVVANGIVLIGPIASRYGTGG